jgi:opacity protein-like surface antigen
MLRKRPSVLALGCVICLASPSLTVAPAFAAAAGPGQTTYVQNWSGLYLGGGAGGLWGEQTGDFITGASPAVNGFPASTAGPLHPLKGVSSGGAAGLDIGYNFQSGPFVLGAEASLGAIGYDANFGISPNPSTPDFRYGGISREYAYFKQRANGLGEFRGRAGYAAGNLLVYVSAGLAVASTTLKSNFPGNDAISTSFPSGFPTSIASQSAMLAGYTVGGGFDYKISERWALGLEYQHLGFANGHFALGERAVQGRSTQMGFLPPVVAFSYAPVSANSGWQADMALLKLSYFLEGN